MFKTTPQWIFDIHRDKDKNYPYAVQAEMLMARMEEHPQDKDYILAWVTLLIWYDDKYEECIAHAQATIPQMITDSCIAQSYQLWGKCLQQLGKPEEGVKLKEKALEYNGYEWFLLDEIAKDYQELEDVENEIKNLELLVDYHEGDERQFSRLAELYEDKGDHENGAKYYGMYVQDECESSEWAISNCGRALALAGKHDEALVQLRFALFLNPRNATAHYHIADICEGKGDIYRALHHYYEALKAKPDFAFVYNRLGAIAYNEEGDIKNAIAHMEKGVEINKDPEVFKILYLNLSRLYDKIKAFDKHEYYKAKWAEALGFPPGFVGDLGDEEEE